MSKCYTCRFKGTVPGSTHSSCTAITNIQKQIQCMRAIFQQGYVQMKVNGEETLRKVSFNYHGIVKGWANWPLDFDPAWLTQCDLFLSKTHPYMNQNHTTDPGDQQEEPQSEVPQEGAPLEETAQVPEEGAVAEETATAE